MLLSGLIAVYDNKGTTRIQAVYLLSLPLTTSFRLNVDKSLANEYSMNVSRTGLEVVFTRNCWTVHQSEWPVFQLTL